MTRKESVEPSKNVTCWTLLRHVFTLQSLSWPRSGSLSRAHSQSFAWSCSFKMLISSRVSSEVTFVFFITLEASRLADHFPSRFCCSTKNVWYGFFQLTEGWLRGLTADSDSLTKVFPLQVSPRNQQDTSLSKQFPAYILIATTYTFPRSI